MATPPRRPRPCEACRNRHLKCDGNGNNTCSNCKRSQLSCIRTTKSFRFKHAAKPKRTPGFSADQPWLQTSKPNLSFLDETAEVARASEQEASSTPTEQAEIGLLDAMQTGSPSNTTTAYSHPTVDHSLPSPSLTSPVVSEHLLHQDIPPNEQQQQQQQQQQKQHDFNISPSAPASVMHSNARPMSGLSPFEIGGTTTSPTLTTNTEDPLAMPSVGLQEACLIRHFVDDLAHSFDTTDRDAHFTLVIPQRAMHSPVLLYAMCTASARHLTTLWARKNPNTTLQFNGVYLPELNEESAIHYHNVCLSLLKDFTNTPASEENAETRADALAATTILRYYEQLDTSLTGLDSEAYQSVVHTIMCTHHAESLFTMQGMQNPNRDVDGYPVIADTLRASACIIALRQEIWSVLLYRSTDDFVWSNRIILWCADVLRFCFGPDTATVLACSASTLAYERWDSMKAFEETWTVSQPSCFRPLYYSPPNPTRHIYFPVIWHVNDCQVIGMQHLELGRMLLAVYNPRRQRVGIGSSAMNNAIEHQLRQSILRLCGLALANKKFQAGMTTAAIGISIGGEYFHQLEEQQAVIEFLTTLEEEHAWPTKTVVYALQDAWSLQRAQPTSSIGRGPASV